MVDLVAFFPHTPHQVGTWTLGLAVAYLLIAWLTRLQLPEPAKVFDAAVFATSVLLLCGVIDEQVAKALGDTTSFLIIAGLVGVLYSIRLFLHDFFVVVRRTGEPPSRYGIFHKRDIRLARLDLLIAVGATAFDLTLMTRAGKKEWFRLAVPLAELARTVPGMLDDATDRECNIIIRPHGRPPKTKHNAIAGTLEFIPGPVYG